MKIPQRLKKLEEFTDELIHDCTVSRPKRVTEYQYWMNYYYSGTADQYPAIYNKCYPHVDKLASHLYSPVDVRYSIEFDDFDEGLVARGEAAAKYLTRQTKRTKCNLAFSQALDYALPKGKCLLKIVWTRDGLKPYIIQPDFFGVLREDVDNLDSEDQEAFVLSSWHLPQEFERQLEGHPDKDSILKRIKSSLQSETDETRPGNMVHQIVMGGIQPVPTTPPANVQRGMVSVTGGPIPNMSPEVMRQLVRRDEIWVWDDDREDYTTIVSAAGAILEGRYKHRNLCDLKGEHPFIEITANPVDGYFWGRSELACIQPLQDTLNQRVNDMTRLLGLRADPSIFYSGISGITAEKHRAMRARGGFLTDPNPNGKVQPIVPEMPPDLLQQVEAVLKYIDDVGGFPPIMQGEGDAGVRAGVHAETLVRTGSPRLRDRALLIESQCEDMGDFAFKMLQAKEPRVFTLENKEEFFLSQMPDDYRVVVDSHSASPAFSQDARNLAFGLAKAQAIDGVDLIDLTQPPYADRLIARARKREQARAQQAAQQAAQGKPGPKPKKG